MGFSLSLTAYVEENKADIITKAILGGVTLGQGVDIRTGIKSTEKIPNLDVTVPFQSGSSCAFNASGTTTLDQISIATNPIAIAQEWCLKDLEAYYTQKYLPAGQLNESLSIEAQIMDRMSAKIASQVESMIWGGKTTYGNSTVLKQINGWLATIDTAGTAVAATASTLNSTNVLTIFDDIYSKIPAAALYNENVVAFCGMDTFRTLAAKITSTYGIYGSNYNTDGVWSKWTLMYPGTNMKVIAVPGLNADANGLNDTGSVPTAIQNRIVATYASNLVFGTDLVSDLSTLESWYDKNTRKVKVYGEFRAGTAVKYMTHVVQYTNS